MVSPEDADLVLELERHPEVECIYALAHAPPDWPRLFVALREDNAYALGVVSSLIVRALPHRDRAYVGVAGTERLRTLWTPLGEPLALSLAERRDATARREERESGRIESNEIPFRSRVVIDDAPLSVPTVWPFTPDLVWTFRGKEVVQLEVVPDPFRDPPIRLLVVTDDDALFGRLERTAPRAIMIERARTAAEAATSIARSPPVHVVCDETMALGDEGLLDWIEQQHPSLAQRFEIVCSEKSADWVTSYLANRARRPNVIETGFDDDEELLADLIARVRARDA